MKDIAAMIVLVLAAALSSAGADPYASSTRVKVGDDAPDFTCTTLGGEPFTLSEVKGKVVLINFFATWCGPCVAEMPHLEKDLYQKFKANEKFELISIGREHEAKDLTGFYEKHKLSFPMAPDPKRAVYGKYAEKYIPRNVLIGKDGKVKLSSVGYSAEEFKTLIQTIETELVPQ